MVTLHDAVRLMSLDRVKELVEAGANVNEINKGGQTPLHLFDFKCDSTVQIELLRFFLEHGASVNIPEHDDFHLSCWTVTANVVRKGNANLVKLLMEYGVDLSARENHKHSTLLHCAVENKNSGVIELFKSIDIDVNALDAFLVTPLGCAIICVNIDAAKFLLKNGANANGPCSSSCPPLALAVFEHARRKENWEDCLKFIEILLLHGADCETISFKPSGKTLLGFIQYTDSFVLAEPFISCLAMREAFGVPIEKNLLSTIYSNEEFKNHFSFCRHMIKEMKRTIIHNRITLFSFLEENEKQLALYARNPACVAKLKMVLHSKRNSDVYIMKTLRKRIAKAFKTAELREKSADIIAKFTGLGRNCDVIDIIIMYLNNQDLKNVCKV